MKLKHIDVPFEIKELDESASLLGTVRSLVSKTPTTKLLFQALLLKASSSVSQHCYGSIGRLSRSAFIRPSKKIVLGCT